MPVWHPALGAVYETQGFMNAANRAPKLVLILTHWADQMGGTEKRWAVVVLHHQSCKEKYIPNHSVPLQRGQYECPSLALLEKGAEAWGHTCWAGESEVVAKEELRRKHNPEAFSFWVHAFGFAVFEYLFYIL